MHDPRICTPPSLAPQAAALAGSSWYSRRDDAPITCSVHVNKVGQLSVLLHDSSWCERYRCEKWTCCVRCDLAVASWHVRGIFLKFLLESDVRPSCAGATCCCATAPAAKPRTAFGSPCAGLACGKRIDTHVLQRLPLARRSRCTHRYCALATGCVQDIYVPASSPHGAAYTSGPTSANQAPRFCSSSMPLSLLSCSIAGPAAA